MTRPAKYPANIRDASTSGILPASLGWDQAVTVTFQKAVFELGLSIPGRVGSVDRDPGVGKWETQAALHQLVGA